MPALTEEQKLLVVTRLASFVSPAEVIDELKLLRVAATPQQLSAYDPGNAAGRRLSKELKELFEETRRRYLDDLSDVPIAHQAGRLRMLDAIARQAVAARRPSVAMQAIEMAAKEAGGLFVRPSDRAPGAGTGSPLGLPELTDQEIDDRLAAAERG